MSVFTKCLILALLPIALGSPIDNIRSFLAPRVPKSLTNKRVDSFVWASVGDSWAAGVSYNTEHTDYDDDKNGCHRWKDSYGPIIERNTSWTTGVQTFNFAACRLTPVTISSIKNCLEYSYSFQCLERWFSGSE